MLNGEILKQLAADKPSGPVPETVTLYVPFRVVRRGGRKEMQLPEGAAQPRRTDKTLVKALARFPLEADAAVWRVRHHRRTG